MILFLALFLYVTTMRASVPDLAQRPIERVRQVVSDYPTHSDITGLKVAYSIPMLIDPDSPENQETNLFCQLFTIIHILRAHDKEMFHNKSYPVPPDIVVPIHHVSNSAYRPSANITEEAKRLRVIFIYGGPCGLTTLPGSSSFSVLDYHVNDRAPFMMLNSFGLVEYDHVIHLDLNIWPTATAMDFFWHTSFNQPADSLWGYYFSTNAPITRALLLLRPSGEAYTEMCRLLDDGFGGPEVGWNHHGVFESAWCDMPYLGCKKSHRWTFTRASMEMGVIYYFYHVRKSRWSGVANLSREKKFVFYSSNRKPWLPSHGRVWKDSWYSWKEDFLEMLDKSPNKELCQSVQLELKKWKPRQRLQSYPFEELLETHPLPGFYII